MRLWDRLRRHPADHRCIVPVCFEAGSVSRNETLALQRQAPPGGGQIFIPKDPPDPVATPPESPVIPPFTNFASAEMLHFNVPVDFFTTAAFVKVRTAITIIGWFKLLNPLNQGAEVPVTLIMHGGSTAAGGGAAGNNWWMRLIQRSGSLSPNGSNIISFEADGNASIGGGAHRQEWFAPGGVFAAGQWYGYGVKAIAGSNFSRCWLKTPSGVAEISSSLFGPPANVFFNAYNAPITLGARDDSGFPFAPGRQDETAVFSVAKSDADIVRYLTNGPIDLSGEPDIEDYWRFENNPNNLISARHFAPQNAATYSTDHP